ncbi:heat shock protein transcriptional repressor HspR [Bifidobacterium avesanii]|uniref:MerR family transcriptional regulator n=1 Tax=Bifidobacterium avesanii TaxID=1798157 RepID=A0A7K3TIY6_9BIFI|nr:helix-turn-helix transcriptional regulator [Bifidobacterium avesanii]KAB8291951.1 MerR family transcriptional regulator [Bifidobacterium avesanii]NEG79052.1 MerR family transcriptional regulator [Bifidobacterium avesanii]
MARIAQQIRKAYALCAQMLVEGRAELDELDDMGFDVNLSVFTVSQAATVAGVHPQTLRQYDRVGLVTPRRTGGGARRYSLRDLDRLVQAQHLSQDESINLAGITRILALQEENRQLRRQVRRLRKPAGSSIFAADADGDIVEVQRSRRARMWRHEIHAHAREITAGPAQSLPPAIRPAAEAATMVVWRG